jgi:FMNH2-dependent dimethyl sulfone monooxygenase
VPDPPALAIHPRSRDVTAGVETTDARGMGGRVTDWYFMNGNSPDGIAEQVHDVSDAAAVHGRAGHVRFGVNGFMIGLIKPQGRAFAFKLRARSCKPRIVFCV